MSYPVSVYVIDGDGKCVSLQELKSASDELKMQLEAGTYDVYAVAGTNNYNLPTKDDAVKDAIIEPKDVKNHGDYHQKKKWIMLIIT